ncbi:restriction endonuclease [Salmonella enterica subsp. diarizonae]|nr:restriction endonuclease [Salmonella enterica subsp. diarizonae]
MLQTLFLLFLSVAALVIAGWFRRMPGARVRRHHRYRQTAGRVLVRLPQLASDGARLNYLRRLTRMSLKSCCCWRWKTRD